MTETKPQHRLIIYDQNGEIIWDGLLTSPFPVLEPGSVFWTGGFAPPQKRQWYTVEKSMAGVETQTGQLVTELVVSRSKEERADPRASCEHSDQPSRAVKRYENEKLHVIEEVQEFAVKLGLGVKTSWRNSAKTIRLDFIGREYDPSVDVHCFTEGREGPQHQRYFLKAIGSRADIQLQGGKLTILTTEAHGNTRLVFRIIEFRKEI